MFRAIPNELSEECNARDAGDIVLSDTHLGDLENGERKAVVGLIRDASRYAIEHKVGITFNGDTFDYYLYADFGQRMYDSEILRECLPEVAGAGLPITFVSGNHDPALLRSSIQKYTGLLDDQFDYVPDFYMPYPEVLITHGHKVQLLNISKLARRFHAELSETFGDDWNHHPISIDIQRSILELLTHDEELQKESDRVDRYYQNGIDHPDKRWRTRCLHGAAMFFQSTKGWASAGLGRCSKSLAEQGYPPVVQEILRWLASGCRLSLTHRALRFAKSLNIPIIVCGHNHVPQIEEEVLHDRHGTSEHIYANCGSAYQRGQINTAIHIDRRQAGQTHVNLLQHTSDGFSQIDTARYDVSP